MFLAEIKLKMKYYSVRFSKKMCHNYVYVFRNFADGANIQPYYIVSIQTILIELHIIRYCSAKKYYYEAICIKSYESYSKP